MDPDLKKSCKEVPTQAADATMCSNDGAFALGSSHKNKSEINLKVKSYVDFAQFNKNYDEYMEKIRKAKQSDGAASTGNPDDHQAEIITDVLYPLLLSEVFIPNE